jgi:hypothetical protein
MMVIAAAAAVCWVERLSACRKFYASRVAAHAEQESNARLFHAISGHVCGEVAGSMTPEELHRFIASARSYYANRIAYHAALKAKYERAARYPWLPIAPDPPEPERS